MLSKISHLHTKKAPLHTPTKTFRSYATNYPIHMKLEMNPELAEGYKSASQIARVLTEAWFDDNMYCLACSSNELERLKAGTRVVDFICPDCNESYQLKAKSGRFGRTVANSEYHTKIEKIEKGLSPNWAFLQYSRDDMEVMNLMVIPKHFMTLDAVVARKPLSDSARRSGWVGSNILMDRLPPDARLQIITDRHIRRKKNVRAEWKQFEFLKKKGLETKGWLNDVLSCVRELDKKEFTLTEMYSFVPKLEKLYPDNDNIKPKIRQQLQFLRDNNIIEFLERGKYRISHHF